VVCVLLSVLTVLPVRFLYPNLAPRPWRAALLLGAAAWTILITGMLPSYPHTPVPVVLASLAYPVFYVGLSLALDRKARLAARTVRPG
jgi:phosphatidylcholine synthase